MGFELLPIFSIAGIVFNVIAFKKGTVAGCLGLVAGFLGAIATAFGSWPIGLIILIGLGLLAFIPKPTTDADEAASGLTDYQRRTGDGVSGGATSDPSQFRATYAENEPVSKPDYSHFRATYADDEPASTPEVAVATPAEAAQEVASYLGDDVDARVQEIEDDFVAGRIDRATYVARRRELL